MDKRERILNTVQELFKEGTAGTASVSDIAKRAGIAKGGLYYYFQSKEEVLDALIEREYKNIIEHCNTVLKQSNSNSLENFALLFETYMNSYIDPSMDKYLHMPQNAALHQKSLAKILSDLSPIVANIISQGVEEGTFICEYPNEYAEIVLSTFTFLFDPGIFSWTPAQYRTKAKALANILEKGLSTKTGSFYFIENISLKK